MLLISNYLNEKITPVNFRSKFIKMVENDSEESGIILNDFQKLETFIICENSKKFSNFIDEILTLCRDYDIIWDQNIQPMSESEFYKLINNNYLELQKYQ